MIVDPHGVSAAATKRGATAAGESGTSASSNVVRHDPDAGTTEADVRVERLLAVADRLCERADYNRAERLFRRIIAWLDARRGVVGAYADDGCRAVGSVVGTAHPTSAAGVNAGAVAREDAGTDRAPSEPPREIALRGQLLTARNNLAVLYKFTGRFDEARRLYRACLKSLRGAHSPDFAALATVYHNLGGLEHARRRFRRGEPFARRSVELRRQVVGENHVDLAADWAALGALIEGQRRHSEAEALYRRAIAIFEAAGGDHPDFVFALNNLATVRQAQGDLDEAETTHRRVLALKRERLGPEHPDLAATLNNLGLLLRKRGDTAGARAYLLDALLILRRHFGPGHVLYERCRANLDDQARSGTAP